MNDKKNINISDFFKNNNVNRKDGIHKKNNENEVSIKKKNIWSLFSNVTETLKDKTNEEDDNDSSEMDTDIFFTPRNITQNIEKNTNKTLFKKTHENPEIKKEIENIANSFKRKNNILLTDKSDSTILNSILSTKKIKLNSEKNDTPTTPTYNAYKEFFMRIRNQNKSTEINNGNMESDEIKDKEKKTMHTNIMNIKVCSKIEGDDVNSRIIKLNEKNNQLNKCHKIITSNQTGSYAPYKTELVTSVKEGDNKISFTSIIKKKNICVPVNNHNKMEIKKKSDNLKKRTHHFSKHDKYDIFNNIGDDVFRYIFSYIENKNLMLLNKRFCKLSRLLRTKLIYNESLKNSISPESILKTIFVSANIEVLDLSGCSHISSHHFNLLANSNHVQFNKTLKVLCLKNCSKITDSNLKYLLHRFKNLQTVDIRNCYKISHEGIYPLKFKTSLKKLYMGNLISTINVSNYHSDDTLKALFSASKKCSAPTVDTNYNINIANHTNMNESNSTSMVEENIQLDTPLTNLICLEITYTRNLTDISNLYMIGKNLKILNLKGCNIDNSSSIIFKNFPNLLALNLADTKISNDVIETVCNTSKGLKTLDISKTFEIRNSTIFKIPRYLTGLKKIKIASLSNVDNFCIREIFKYCKNLTSIDFSNCWKVNNSFCNLNGLEVASGNKLKDVGAYQCSIDRSVCEEALLRMGCTSIRVHIYNELKMFETSIYTDIESLEQD
ncbi:leucine-rich repeat protein [Plasmodium vinckei]|uniref:Leucine-rich repeat protein n=1 Tax=Plasmodium vinckei TaxID=5860 RepID=A0A6V7SY06_PLAVN|nr:leucine-rich repeat protein [Plasmodium vinckei]